MIIKKYIANDMREALVRVKYELGTDALIVGHKMIRVGKWYHFFRKKMIEVTVAVDERDKREPTGIFEGGREEDTRIISDLERIIRQSAERLNEQESIKVEGQRQDTEVFGYQEKVREKWEEYSRINNGLDIDKSSLSKFIGRVYGENGFDKGKKLGRVNVIIGPTGVGKTTTIAKIAGKALLEDNISVGLITIDTYRIAAVEQLKKYAKILNIPCEVIKEPSEIAAKLRKLRDCDIILIDTIGASPKDSGRIEDIKEYLNELPMGSHVYLAMSMSQDLGAINKILDKYKGIGYQALILTKFDEVENFNNFWGLMETNKLPIQYFCNGQDVAEDIQEASTKTVLDYLWEEIKYGGPGRVS